MKYLTLITLILCGTTNAFANEAIGKTYRFTTPENVRFESNDEHEFYSFHWGEASKNALLMLYPNPVAMSVRTLKPMADMMEITFEDQMKSQGQAVEIKTERRELKLGVFEGVELEFTISHNTGITIKQWILILHDGTHIWNGQLTAHSAEDIEIAHKIIEQAARIESVPTKAIEE